MGKGPYDGLHAADVGVVEVGDHDNTHRAGRAVCAAESVRGRPTPITRAARDSSPRGLTATHLRRPLQVLAERRPALVDCSLLVAAVLASGALHVTDLGFHGDDWGWFGEIRLLDDRSLPGIVQGLYDRDVGLHQRPTQLVYVAM